MGRTPASTRGSAASRDVRPAETVANTSLKPPTPSGSDASGPIARAASSANDPGSPG